MVRYSGTEPILRIMAEGENPELVGALVIRLRSQLESAFASNGTRKLVRRADEVTVLGPSHYFRNFVLTISQGRNIFRELYALDL